MTNLTKEFGDSIQNTILYYMCNLYDEIDGDTLGERKPRIEKILLVLEDLIKEYSIYVKEKAIPPSADPSQ